MTSIEFLQTKEGQRIKIYLVVGLALVLVSLAYFRFFHKKPKPGKATAVATAPAAQFEVPQPEIVNRKNTIRREAVVREAGRVVIRDIFAPLRSLPRASRLPAKRESSDRVSSLQLRGVIIGGNNSIAIINDKLVRKGERVGDYKVVRIRKKEVLLKSANESLRLKLENNE